jgi:hypothetical protein
MPLSHIAQGEIKVFASADKMKPTLNALLTSLKAHNYSYEVLGMGKPWKGFKTKMENYLEGINRYVKEKGPEAFAIFVDAFDVLCIKDSDKVMASYKSKPRPMPIVVGTEIICFYNENCSMDALDWYDHNKIPGGSQTIKNALTKPEPERPYYKSPTSVFLNSGFIMGPAEELRALFQEMMDSGDTDDQIAVIHYMKNHPEKVDYDMEDAMIRNKLEPRTKLPDEDGTQGPGFIHFPGSRTDDEQKITLAHYGAYM